MGQFKASIKSQIMTLESIENGAKMYIPISSKQKQALGSNPNTQNKGSSSQTSKLNQTSS